LYLEGEVVYIEEGKNAFAIDVHNQSGSGGGSHVTFLGDGHRVDTSEFICRRLFSYRDSPTIQIQVQNANGAFDI
jgi:hypothetical protein